MTPLLSLLFFVTAACGTKPPPTSVGAGAFCFEANECDSLGTPPDEQFWTCSNSYSCGEQVDCPEPMVVVDHCACKNACESDSNCESNQRCINGACRDRGHCETTTGEPAS